MDVEALAEANNARAYTEAAWSVFKENRKPQYPYIDKIDIECGPLLFLCGHALEISCKAILRASGIENRRLTRFQGFRYYDGGRKKRSEHRRHNVSFLFRAVHFLVLNKEERVALNFALGAHQYWTEKHEHQLDPPERPTTPLLKHHIALLDQGFDRPYSYRYAKLGYSRLPSAEFLLVALNFLNGLDRTRLFRPNASIE